MKKILLSLVLISCLFCKKSDAKPFQPQTEKGLYLEILADSTITNNFSIVIYDNAFFPNDSPLAEQIEYKPVSVVGRLSKFVLPSQSKPRYFSVINNDKDRKFYVLKMFLFEPGDKIKMEIKSRYMHDQFDVVFTGVGAAKYTCQQNFQHKSTVQSKMEILNKYRPEMSVYSCQLFQADIIAESLAWDLLIASSKKDALKKKGDTIGLAKFKADLLKEHGLVDMGEIPKNVLYSSKDYLFYRFREIIATLNIQDKSDNVQLTYQEIAKIKDAGLRDRLFVLFFIHRWEELPQNFDSLLQATIATTTNRECRDKLKTFLHNANGSKAFNFSLPDAKGKIVKLSDFKGKAVFVDYYFTSCAYCKIFYQKVLSGMEKKYANNPKIVFLTISIDNDKKTWLKTLEEGEYTSNTSVNLYTNGEGARHALIQYHNILSYPALMLIDQNGAIFKFAGNEMRNVKGLEEALKKVLEK